MRLVEIEDLKFQSASADEADRLNFYSNNNTSVPRIYKSFGLSGFYLLAIVLMSACFVSVFLAEIARALLPFFVVAWRVALLYLIASVGVYGIIYIWYKRKHSIFTVIYATCIDIIDDPNTDVVTLVFLTDSDEKFLMKKDDFAYIPESFTVFVRYIIAKDTRDSSYITYQIE